MAGVGRDAWGGAGKLAQALGGTLILRPCLCVPTGHLGCQFEAAFGPALAPSSQLVGRGGCRGQLAPVAEKPRAQQGLEQRGPSADHAGPRGSPKAAAAQGLGELNAACSR